MSGKFRKLYGNFYVYEREEREGFVMILADLHESNRRLNLSKVVFADKVISLVFY